MDRGERQRQCSSGNGRPSHGGVCHAAVAAQGHEGWHEGNDGNDGSDDVEHEWPGQRRRLGRR